MCVVRIETSKENEERMNGRDDIYKKKKKEIVQRAKMIYLLDRMRTTIQ